MSTALIFGVTGQDGSYLSELLLLKKYKVIGVIRRSSYFNTYRVEHLIKNKFFKLIYGDVTDYNSIFDAVKKYKPDEIYNLAAQSHVKVSFDLAEYTTNTNALGCLKILDVIKNLKMDCRFYQASTSELYGNPKIKTQDENTNFNPSSPYAISKAYAFYTVKNYRESYNIFATNGILFNHESPRRGETFVTKKISSAVAKIKHGMLDKLVIGNLDSKRDWGYAPEYVYGMWKMLQKTKPNDYVLATGRTNSVRNFIQESFKYLDIKIIWKGKGVNEIGIDSNSGKKIVEVSKKYFRPNDVNYLLGNPSRAKKELGWISRTKFKKLVGIMIEHDYNFYKSKK